MILVCARLQVSLPVRAAASGVSGRGERVLLGQGMPAVVSVQAEIQDACDKFGHDTTTQPLHASMRVKTRISRVHPHRRRFRYRPCFFHLFATFLTAKFAQ